MASTAGGAQKRKAKILLALTSSLLLLAVILLLVDHLIGAAAWSAFFRTLAGALTGSFVGSFVTFASLYMVDSENEIPEVYGALNVTRILKQQYFAKDFVLRLTLSPDLQRLVFEIGATYVPVKVPCACRILRVSEIEKWGGKITAQFWSLGAHTLDLNGIDQERNETLNSSAPGFVTFQYHYQFGRDGKFPKQGLNDTHRFVFFCESARVEAFLPPHYHLRIEKGEKKEQLIPVHLNTQVTENGLQKSVCWFDGAWASGDEFTWTIFPAAIKDENEQKEVMS